MLDELNTVDDIENTFYCYHSPYIQQVELVCIDAILFLKLNRMNAAIGLYAADKRIDQTTTDKAGNFAISFEAKLLGQGQFGITARTETSATRDASVSPPVVVAIAAPQPVPSSSNCITK